MTPTDQAVRTGARAGTADPAAPVEPTAVNPHLRRLILIVGEILRASLWIPLVIALIPLTLAFHLVVPAIAQAERAVARAAGASNTHQGGEQPSR